MGSFSLVHWLVVILVLLLVFGPRRLSEVGKGLGQGIRNFKKGIEGKEEAGEEEEEETEERRPKKLRGEGSRPAKRLKPAQREEADDDRADEEDDEPEEEEARPRKKSRQA